MSTKTTFKRIALVAAVALGLGGLSTVPANAATTQAMVESISLAQVTAAPAINAAVDVNFGAAIGDVTGAADGDDLKFKGYLSAYPAGGFAGVTASATASGTDGELAGVTAAVGAQANTADTVSGATYNVDLTDASELSDNSPSSEGNITASAIQGAGMFSFTPTVAGAYTLSVWFDQDNDGVIDIGEAVQTINLTVAGQASFSNVLSTSFLDDAASYDATVDEEVRVSKTAGTNGASIMVTLKDVNGSAFYGARVQADVSGPGYVDAVTGGTAYADATARTDYVDLASDVNTARVHVTADGTSGTSTITITIKNATTLATLGTFTEKMYFYGTVASLTATKNYNIARANATERGCAAATGCISDGSLAETPFVLIVAKDAEGNLVPGLAVTAKITDTAVIAASTVAAVTDEASATTAGVTTDPNGLGYYNASVAGNVAATSGSKTTVSYRTLLADGVTYVTSNAVEITIGGAAANETLTFDKASYEAGEGMTVTRTCKDASGNACYDGYAAGAVTFSKAVSGSAAADIYLDGKVTTDNSRGAKTVFAPVAGGSFTGTMTGKTAAATAEIVATATVTSSESAASNAATDAANEATDAANAATDAALAAADAADAATAAAQDASDAVAALSAEVSKMISSLKAQITSLTNLVIKIQKKVKA